MRKKVWEIHRLPDVSKHRIQQPYLKALNAHRGQRVFPSPFLFPNFRPITHTFLRSSTTDGP